MPMDRYPLISEQLLAALNEDFPEKTPTLSEPLERIRERGGERKVVWHLVQVYRAQNPTREPEEGDDVQS